MKIYTLTQEYDGETHVTVHLSEADANKVAREAQAADWERSSIKGPQPENWMDGQGALERGNSLRNWLTVEEHEICDNAVWRNIPDVGDQFGVFYNAKSVYEDMDDFHEFERDLSPAVEWWCRENAQDIEDTLVEMVWENLPSESELIEIADKMEAELCAA